MNSESNNIRIVINNKLNNVYKCSMFKNINEYADVMLYSILNL